MIKIVFQTVQSPEIHSYNKCTYFTWHLQLLQLSVPGLFWRLLFSAGLFPSLPASTFPFYPLGIFFPFFTGALLGLCSGFRGIGLADNLVDLLCGSSFTLALSPLASPSAFLLGIMVTVEGHRSWVWGCSSVWALAGPKVVLPSSSH